MYIYLEGDLNTKSKHVHFLAKSGIYFFFFFFSLSMSKYLDQKLRKIIFWISPHLDARSNISNCSNKSSTKQQVVTILYFLVKMSYGLKVLWVRKYTKLLFSLTILWYLDKIQGDFCMSPICVHCARSDLLHFNR